MSGIRFVLLSYVNFSTFCENPIEGQIFRSFFVQIQTLFNFLNHEFYYFWTFVFVLKLVADYFSNTDAI